MNHQDLTPFQLSDLDRLLCERLGIAPTIPARHEFRDQRGRRRACTCGAMANEGRALDEKCPARCDHFPKLSTTGDGMVALMEALNRASHDFNIAPDPHGVEVLSLRGDRCTAQNKSYPLALALAAAAALGIEVSE